MLTDGVVGLSGSKMGLIVEQMMGEFGGRGLRLVIISLYTAEKRKCGPKGGQL